LARLAVVTPFRAPSREAGAVFEEILGIPAHPLIVHAAVVFVPLQVAAAFAYALVPFVRRFTAWLVVALAVVAPLSAFAAKFSGEAFRRRLIRHGTTDTAFLDKLVQHKDYADITAYASLILSALMLLMVYIYAVRSRRRASPDADLPEAIRPVGAPRVLTVILAVAVVGMGGTTGYYIFKTGDTGAHIVWSGQ
jgi:uncharacterized membrane protein